MSFIEWDESFVLNIELIDIQHRKLVNYINEFYDHIKEDKSDAFKKLLDNLTEYTEKHFKYEENYFEKFNYPDSEEHIKEHQVFIDKIKALKSKLDSGQLVITPEITMFLRDWLVNHVKGSDKKYSGFFIKKGLK